MMETKRINKYLGDAGVCTRREADQFIEEGHVTIDGKEASIGSRVRPGQEVRLFGEVVRAVNKPAVQPAPAPRSAKPAKRTITKKVGPTGLALVVEKKTTKRPKAGPTSIKKTGGAKKK